MKKETIIATVLGIAAGISIALFVLVNARRASNSGDVINENITPTIAIDTNSIEPLLITSPNDETVTSEETVDIIGTSSSNAVITIQTPSEEQVIENDAGEFKATLTLLPGENHIRITAYSKKNIDSRSLVIYYIEE